MHRLYKENAALAYQFSSVNSGHLRSASQRKFVVPRYQLNSFGRRSFAVANRSTWILLPDSLRDPKLSLDTFKRQLTAYFFSKY